MSKRSHPSYSLIRLHFSPLWHTDSIFFTYKDLELEAIGVILEKHAVDTEAVEATWKLVANQSERQLGAYYFLYLQEFGRGPEKMKLEWVTFRNQVIHKGHIPKYAEVMEYAEYLFHYLIRVIIELKLKSGDVLMTWLARREAEYKASHPEVQLDVISYPTFIDLTNTKDELTSLSFNDTVKKIDTYMDQWLENKPSTFNQTFD